MPEFKSATADSILSDLTNFAKGYVLAIYFTDTGDNEQPGSEALMDAASLADCVEDCAEFQRVAAAELAEAYERDYSEERAGHDFWLTRNHHGAGYWDRDELEAGGLGDKLTTLAQAMGEVYTGGDDETLYILG